MMTAPKRLLVRLEYFYMKNFQKEEKFYPSENVTIFVMKKDVQGIKNSFKHGGVRVKCPDCKKGELVYQETAVGKDWETWEIQDAYYKCDICKTEYQPEDVEV